ncbi:hypothetical protein KR067_012377 [Drosophila pandora]|nr:hypothetical protein KR067_012377 [Drosophila pandora]
MKCLAQLGLSSLNLSDTSLRKVPDLNDPGFRGIKELNLSGNNITELADWKFGSMEELLFVNISHNKLTSLPNKEALSIKMDLSYNQLENMTDLVPLIKAKAILIGNSWRCMCNNSHVKQMYRKFPRFMENNIVCKKDDQLEPFAMHCHEIINNTENLEPNATISFRVLIVSIIILYVICIIFLLLKYFFNFFFAKATGIENWLQSQ